VPLPGVYLLLVVLSVNLVAGGILRIRKDLTTMGVLVAHTGVLVMFAGALIESTYSQKGHTTMAEGTDVAEFESYYDWEIAVAKAAETGPVTEFVIPGERFMGLAAGELSVFNSPEIPFDVVVHDVLANCEPMPAASARPMWGKDGRPLAVGLPVDGMALVEDVRNKEAEADTAGVYVTVRTASGALFQGILWARERFPMSVDADGSRWTIGLSHRRWKLPFTVHLDQFHRELHPGTGMAKAFESDVTKIQNGVPQKVKISMNAPLRQDGCTLFQSGFMEPGTPGAGGRWWSIFSVVRNPADRVPLFACIVITVGLLLHFSQKLVRHVRTQTWRRTRS
jgi:cytochrome c biogenesis protein ResB